MIKDATYTGKLNFFNFILIFSSAFPLLEHILQGEELNLQRGLGCSVGVRDAEVS